MQQQEWRVLHVLLARLFLFLRVISFPLCLLLSWPGSSSWPQYRSFSCLFLAASLICSFTFNCSLISWLSLVFFLLISSLRFLSNLSCSDIPARLAANFSLSSCSLAFFSSSVRGAISSVDSEKSWCPVLLA